MEGKVYGFRVEGIKVTDGAEVTEMAEKAKVSEMVEMAEMAKIPERVQGIQMTTRHVIQPVAKMAKASIKTARHVMWSLGEVAV
jgi:hypothetical protein